MPTNEEIARLFGPTETSNAEPADAMPTGRRRIEPTPTPDEPFMHGRCMKVCPKTCPSIDFEMKDGVHSFGYMHLTHHAFLAADGSYFWHVWGMEEKHKTVVKGTGLREAFDRINDHCARILRVLPGSNFESDGTLVITGLMVMPLPATWTRENDKG